MSISDLDLGKVMSLMTVAENGGGFLEEIAILQTFSRWRFQICVYVHQFTPLFGEDEPILTNIFEMG